ncbi:HAMP domain-containing sensor histidine kinase [Methanonatronarchaeum sp. AMET-Sl]|uniref:sensor histidine kinase n=1 Tax=Methanonatronarchaeum sp. AMET-Sl TaxID=3037654 RepID=UPI00244E0CB3|nr:HAMP domain-containing sensor histidine kinase [Methanonatronarchaeum sp. AMET-Sl]WGI17722.1 HAMP domain-containing sensor histidine kinase [Methanonatronarchaeum sp. AMET-Sl]
MVLRDITERVKTKEREKFLHTLLRHDVRNKTEVGYGYLELLCENIEVGSKITNQEINYIQKSIKSVKEEIEIIEKVKTLHKAEKTEKTEKNLTNIIKDVINEYKDEFREKNIELHLDIPDQKCIVEAGDLLDRVFGNIIGNALQHADPKSIKIEISESGEKVVCAISDDGKGIPDKDKQKVWRRGFTTDRDRGTGLGLFLVKTIIDIYGGNAEIKDSSTGGTTFKINLKKPE